MVRSLIALGWLRDVVLVVLACAGNHLRHTSPLLGVTILLGTALIFTERFVWSWHLCDLRDRQSASPDQSL